MNAIPHLITERVDDIPRLLEQMQRMGLPALLDAHFPTHGNWQGRSLGWLTTIWLSSILSRGDHRLVHVERRLVATDPDRKLAARRALRTAGHRRVEHVRALLGERRGEFFDKALRIGREIKPGRVALDAREETVSHERDLLDVGGLRQRS